jgi:hypothetical protein
MMPLQSIFRTLRKTIWLLLGAGIIMTAGCDDSPKPTVKAGTTATTYEVPPPPKIVDGNPITSPNVGKGSMSARELRDYRKKQQGNQP